MTGWGRRLAVTLAIAVVAIAFVAPVGALILKSFVVYDVVLEDGTVARAVEEPDVADGYVRFFYQDDPGGERIAVRKPIDKVKEIRSSHSLHHYEFVFSDRRAVLLVRNSLIVAGLGMLAALLIGVPIAWLLFRTDLPGRRLLLAFCLGPAILPPFLVWMGGARRLMNALHDAFGFTGATLQVASTTVVFGFVLFPFVVLLVGRALAAVPVGPWEAACMLGGRAAAFRRVVLPAVLPALFGSAAIVFVLAWADFTVPDLISFMLPPAEQGKVLNVFPTEIFLQWTKSFAKARATATGVPFVLVTVGILVLALYFLRKSPVVGGGEGRRGRPRVRLNGLGRAAGWGAVLLVLALGIVLPLVDMAGWACGRGETVKTSGEAKEVVGQTRMGELFDFAGAFARTPGLEDDLFRWLKSGLGAALLAMAAAIVLARWATTGGRLARITVLVIAVLPLAVPGLVYSVATTSFWSQIDVPWIARSPLRSILALTARFLPFAIVGAWIVLRELRRGHEEAAALLGAGPTTRALRVWGPVAGWGLVGAGLAVLVLALRELDTIVEIDSRVYPMRIYTKIHFSRLADEANLAFLYVGILLVPAVLAAVGVGMWARRRAAGVS